MFSDKTYAIRHGSGCTAFFAEAEPDDHGYLRGNAAVDMSEDLVIEVEPVFVHVNQILGELAGIKWPEEVTA